MGKFDDSYGLPKQDVATPAGGYLKDSSRETMTAANSKGRNSSDPMGDLHKAGLARNTETANPTGIASSKPKPADSLFTSTENMSASNQTSLGNYGTTTPIDSGFGGMNNGQLTAQQLAAQQPLNPNTPYSGNPNTPTYGQPGYDQFTQQLFAGQSNPQNQMQNQAAFSGQPGNMTAFTPGNAQNPYLNNNDPMYGGNFNAAMPGSSVSPQMVAMNQGTGYGGGQSFGFADPTFNNQTQAYPVQPTSPQGVGAIQQGIAPQNVAMPNGQTTSDPGFGMNGFGNPATSGMSNPSATGTTSYPMFDQTQAYPQGTQTQTYPGYNTTQQPANNGYQSGFSSFGAPADAYEYRPGSTTPGNTAAFGW